MALIGAALVLVVRFGISPWLVPDVHADPAAEFFARWTGRAATPGFAYPPLPWLLYPLLGFVLGRVAGVQRSFLERNSLVFSAALAATALAGSAAGWAFSNAGWDITRYGVHALGFLPLALASIAAAAALSWLLGRARADGSASAHALERGLAMRGVSSLVVVPMHFAAVYSLGLHLLPAPSDSALIAAGIATTMACMLAGRGFGRFAERVERGGNGRAAWIAASVIAAAMTLVLWWLPAHGPHTRHAAAFVAQICLCGLLVWSPGRRTREAS